MQSQVTVLVFSVYLWSTWVLLDKNILKGSMSVLNLHIKCMDISKVLACASEN